MESETIFTSTRPWGYYKVLLETEYCKVKEITVNPHQRLSYQKHFKRSEYWTIVKGIASITLDEEMIERQPGESIHIPVTAAHRIENKANTPLIFIEVQTGTYFGEDDIIRLDDDYGRS